jgi:hypothetical protein
MGPLAQQSVRQAMAPARRRSSNAGDGCSGGIPVAAGDIRTPGAGSRTRAFPWLNRPDTSCRRCQTPGMGMDRPLVPVVSQSPRSGGTPSSLLSRLLEAPELAAAVQGLPAPVLGRLIDRVGLEDAGEIVALASTEQLTDLFDEDLWRAERPGADEVFDPDRFALWLEVMLEAGDIFTARRVTELDPDLLTLALCQLVLVVDSQRLGAHLADAPEEELRVDKALESSLTDELGNYLLVARKPDAWDAVLTVLVALDRDHHDFLEHLLERACYICSEEVEDSGGLYQVLSAAETLVEDAGGARQDRRVQVGFVAPADARAFLALARQTPPRQIAEATTEDPLTQAYFRSYQRPVPASAGGARAAMATVAAGAALPEVSPQTARLTELLLDAQLLPARPPPAPGPAAVPDAFSAAMGALGRSEPALHQQRLLELNYLANLLISGAGIEGRRLRPVEAGELVLEICRLGLGHLGPAGTPDLARFTVVQAFRLGWSLLHQPDCGGHRPSPGLHKILTAGPAR